MMWRTLLKFGLLLVLMAPVSCYEGWDAGNYSGPDDGEEPTPPVAKPIYYILYQPIYLNDSGLNDEDCFSQIGVRTYRKNEWDARSAALQKAMSDLAETVVVKSLGISADDCQTLSLLWNAALSSDPWGDQPPGRDSLDRPVIHLKAVFYDEEPILTPPSAVSREHWEAFDKLAVAGVNARSRHYSVLSNPSNGYFTEWWSGLFGKTLLSGTAIDVVDPTPDGIAARDDIIENDTAAFTNWLLQE